MHAESRRPAVIGEEAPLILYGGFLALGLGGTGTLSSGPVLIERARSSCCRVAWSAKIRTTGAEDRAMEEGKQRTEWASPSDERVSRDIRGGWYGIGVVVLAGHRSVQGPSGAGAREWGNRVVSELWRRGPCSAAFPHRRYMESEGNCCTGRTGK
jgi:hypothetical protein